MPPKNPDAAMIEDVIKELGISHRQAARVFGVSYATIHAWLIGERFPSKRSLGQIADGLDAYGESAETLAGRVRQRLNEKD